MKTNPIHDAAIEGRLHSEVVPAYKVFKAHPSSGLAREESERRREERSADSGDRDLSE